MWEFLVSLLAFGLLVASAAFGFFLRRRLSDRHLSEHNLQALRLVTGLLVTFTALVLSLMLASVKSSFDTTDKDRRLYAGALAQLDQCLRDYGAETAPIRGRLHGYTAAVILSTWPGETMPAGIAYPDPAKMARVGEDRTLAALMNTIGLDIARLNPADPFHQVVAASCRTIYATVLERRTTVVEGAQDASSGPFSRILMFWLMLVFTSFGLQAQRNAFTVVAVTIGALAISTVVFVITDLGTPYTGVFGIPSTAMQQALADMLR